MKNLFLNIGRILVTMSVILEFTAIAAFSFWVGNEYGILEGFIAFGALLLLFLVFNYVVYIVIDIADNLRISADCLENIAKHFEPKIEEVNKEEIQTEQPQEQQQQ